MIVAGLGSRKDVTVDEVLAGIRATADRYKIAIETIGLLATGEMKAQESAFAEAALKLGLPLQILSEEALAAAADRTLTRSEHSLAATGLPSLSEAAALAASGPGATLLGPRITVGPVSCALAGPGGGA